MSRFLISTCLCFLPALGAGQGIPNPGFENWDTNTVDGFEYPNDWTVSTEFYGTAYGKTILQSIPGYSGNYGALVKTILFGFGSDPSVGYMASGITNIDIQGVPELMTGGVPFLNKPSSISGWYKYSSPSAGDFGLVYVISKKWNSSNGVSDTIAYGFGKLLPSVSWKQFTVNVTDRQPGVVPDSLVVAFFSSTPVLNLPGAELFVDGLVLSTDTLGDVGISRIISPVDPVCIMDTYLITLIVQNYGSIAADSFPITYTVDGVLQATEIYPGALAAGDSAEFTFDQVWIPANLDSTELCAFTELPGDIDSTNDSRCKNFWVSVGIGIETRTAPQISLKPNPASRVIMIESDRAISVSLYDLFGNEVLRSHVHSKLQLDVSKLSQGLYFVKMGDRIVRKISIVR